MKYWDFLLELEKTPRTWFLSEAQELRMGLDKANRLCPVTAVCLRNTGTSLNYRHWPEAAEILSLQEELAEAITAAADKTEPYERDIRFDLLRAAGLLK